MKYIFSIDSFGNLPMPTNVYDVIDVLNDELDRRIDSDDPEGMQREKVDILWEEFCCGAFDAGAIYKYPEYSADLYAQDIVDGSVSIGDYIETMHTDTNLDDAQEAILIHMMELANQRNCTIIAEIATNNNKIATWAIAPGEKIWEANTNWDTCGKENEWIYPNIVEDAL